MFNCNLVYWFHLSNNFIYNFHSSGDANVEDDCPGSLMRMNAGIMEIYLSRFIIGNQLMIQIFIPYI